LFELIQKTKHSVKEISFVVARKVTSADCEFIPPLDVTISPVHPEDRFEWASLLIEGFSGQQATAEQVAPMLTSLPGSRAFVGAFKGRRFSASVMGVMDNLATFFGDATVAAGRGHGLQLAHIKRNLSESAQLGCDLASSSVVPGGTSHRNYLRAGFQLVYPRIMFSVET
jgi:hypothetical protein